MTLTTKTVTVDAGMLRRRSLSSSRTFLIMRLSLFPLVLASNALDIGVEQRERRIRRRTWWQKRVVIACRRHNASGACLARLSRSSRSRL